jgi:hypothetical protein
LDELNVPKATSILRLLTDSAIFEFIRTHKGQSMTVDAVIECMISSASQVDVSGSAKAPEPQICDAQVL